MRRCELCHDNKAHQLEIKHAIMYKSGRHVIFTLTLPATDIIGKIGSDMNVAHERLHARHNINTTEVSSNTSLTQAELTSIHASAAEKLTPNYSTSIKMLHEMRARGEPPEFV